MPLIGYCINILPKKHITNCLSAEKSVAQDKEGKLIKTKLMSPLDYAVIILYFII